MTTARVNHRPGFTLIEVTMTVLIIGIVAASVVPLVFSASETYYNASEVRRTAEKTAYAMERTIRLLRDCPEGVSKGTLGITTANANQVRFSDGRGVELTGTTLNLRSTTGTLSPLCDKVTSFVVAYIGNDGTTNTSGTPSTTQRFNITMVSNGFELRSSAFARVRVVDP